MAKEVGLEKGDYVVVELRGQEMIIKPLNLEI